VSHGDALRAVACLRDIVAEAAHLPYLAQERSAVT
jgi:hypothetical protein